MRTSFFRYDFDTLVNIFNENDLSVSGVSNLFNWHYKKRSTLVCTKNLAKKTQIFVDKYFDFSLPKISQSNISNDSTVKFLLELDDNMTIETVLIPLNGRYTICLSSQVGCGMNCSFCFTGTQGLKRNLKTEEIIGQYIAADNWLKSNKLSMPIQNIVFMGQGEPLHNFEPVKTACNIFLDQHGASFGIQKITVSTAGYLPGLIRWNNEMPRVNIALSLHSPFEEKRNKLIPINKIFPLAKVLDYIDSIPLSRKQYIIYEYLLLNEFNDFEEDAHATGNLLAGKMAIINLIPFNPYPDSLYSRPSRDKAIEFQKILETYKIPVLIRGTKGDDILAACGQLNSGIKKLGKNQYEQE